MIDEIRKHKPEGSTHYRNGTFYKIVCDQEIYEINGDELIYVGNVNDKDCEYHGMECIL